jgi:hypothetical protein
VHTQQQGARVVWACLLPGREVKRSVVWAAASPCAAAAGAAEPARPRAAIIALLVSHTLWLYLFLSPVSRSILVCVWWLKFQRLASAVRTYFAVTLIQGGCFLRTRSRRVRLGRRCVSRRADAVSSRSETACSHFKEARKRQRSASRCGGAAADRGMHHKATPCGRATLTVAVGGRCAPTQTPKHYER